MVKFLDLQKQYKSIKDEIDIVIPEVLSSSAFVGGPFLEKFEKNFSKYCDSTYCIGVGNGTDALEIALWSLDLPKGSEVLVPANTFIATSEAVSRNGLKVKFVDCDEYYQLCPRSLEKSINSKTKAIIAVHLYGHPANMNKIISVAKKNNLKLIEDCAQAHGAKYKGQIVGTFGDIATFSFYPGKNLGAYGDGGAIITNNEKLYEKCKMYSNHGRSSKYGHELEGINSRLDGIQAAILDVKLRYLDLWIEKRQNVANNYLKNIVNPLIKLPKLNNAVSAVWHLFVVQVEERDKFMTYLKENDIQCGIHYPTALPKLKAYEYLQNDCSLFKACSEDNKLVSLPIGEHLEQEDIEKVIKIINCFQ